MLNIALFGPPGAGKGTQAKKLIEHYSLSCVATGDLLRGEISAKTPLGLEAKKVIDKGQLVSDEIIVKMIEKHVEANTDSPGILFDGFPRSYIQAYILDELLLRYSLKFSGMISLEVPEKELIKRLLQRSKISGRSDDNPDVIKKRLKEYQKKTFPVKNFYQQKNMLYPVDGVGSIEEVYHRIISIVNENLI